MYVWLCHPNIYTENHLLSDTLSKNYQEMSCRESVIPLDGKHSFPIYGNFIPDIHLDATGQKEGLSLMRKQKYPML